MKNLRVLFTLAFASLATGQGRADSFAGNISNDHLLYLESRDLPGFRENLAASPMGKAMDEVDWKKSVIQILHIGYANLETPRLNQGELAPPGEELRGLLTRIEEHWLDITSHLDGDVALAVGDFGSVVNTFRENKAKREKLQQLDPVSDADPEDTGAGVRLAQEAQLDASELNSILAQFSLWVRVSDRAELETKLERLFGGLLQQQSRQFELRKLDGGDHTLYAMAPALSEMGPGLYWALHRDTLLITLNEQTLRGHLAGLDHPPENPLAEDADYRDAVTFVGEADSHLYFNPARLDSVLRKSLPAASAPSPMGLPPSGDLLNWLALDALLPFTTGIRLQADGFSWKSRMGFTRETALSRILIDSTSAPAPIPDFLHRDFYQVTTTHWHIGEGWNRMEQELVALSPRAAAGLGLARMLAASQLGFDLKLQFFDHLDSGLVVVQSLDPEVMRAYANADQHEDPAAIIKVSMEHPIGGQNVLIGLQIRDKDAMEEALGRLMNRTHPQGLPEPEVIAEVPVHYPVPKSFQGGTFSDAVGLALADDYLLIALGSTDLLKKALLARSDEDLQLRTLPSFTALRAQLPADAESMEYSTSRLQEEGLRMMGFSVSMLKEDYPDLQLPDLEKLARIMDRTLGVTVRKGLVFETESLMKFAD